jgi:acetyltransferase-like isoleucine patch superfamily enzyme
MGGSPTPTFNAFGVLVSDGVLVGDGVLIGDGVLVGDGGAYSTQAILGDNTACMLPAP